MLRHIAFLVLFCYCVEGQYKPCSEGWIYNDGLCYWSSFSEPNAATPLADWFGAQLKCRSMNSDLAYYNNSFEMRLIQSMVNCGSSWLGLVYSSTFGDQEWVWWRNNQIAQVSIESNITCESNVASAAYLAENNTVYAAFPDSLYPFVCIRQSSGPSESGSCDSSSLSPGYLDDDSKCCRPSLPQNKSDAVAWPWSTKRFYYNGNCYLSTADDQQPVDYFAAQLTCQENGMHLPSILNPTENQIVGIVSQCNSAWIGLENIIPGSTAMCDRSGVAWAWEDFSGTLAKTNYTNNWFSDQPTCNDPNAQTVYINPVSISENINEYYWNNTDSYTVHPFSCVYKVPK